MTPSASASERGSQPLVSIVTPSLQQGGLIEQTLLSVQRQTYPNIEHIVVDGGSTDGTLDVLARFAATSGLSWISEPDKGMYEAINKGMNRAHGDIVAYLNGDDLYFPWTIATVVETFEADPTIDVVFGDVISVEEDSGRAWALMHPPFNLDWVRRVGFLAQPAVFWRRRIVDHFGGFDETLKLVADCDYWMRIGRHAHFRSIDEFLAVDRIHEAGLRSTRSDALHAELSVVRSRYVEMSGIAHVIRTAYARIGAAVGRRIRWIRFAFAAAKSEPSGPWSRLLSDPNIQTSGRAILLGMIPGLGQLGARGAIRRQGGWLSGDLPADDGALDRS